MLRACLILLSGVSWGEMLLPGEDVVVDDLEYTICNGELIYENERVRRSFSWSAALCSNISAQRVASAILSPVAASTEQSVQTKEVCGEANGQDPPAALILNQLL